MQLVSPSGDATRPTSDKVREAIFSMLFSRVDLEDVFVADLYAGTGALGLEAFSRGASHVTFVETNSQAIKSIDKNIENAIERTKVPRDSFLNLRMPVLTFVKGERKYGQYDVVFADPPYAHDVETEILNIVAKGGVLIYETSSENLAVCEKTISKASQVDEILTTKKIGPAGIVIAQVR